MPGSPERATRGTEVFLFLTNARPTFFRSPQLLPVVPAQAQTVRPFPPPRAPLPHQNASHSPSHRPSTPAGHPPTQIRVRPQNQPCTTCPINSRTAQFPTARGRRILYLINHPNRPEGRCPRRLSAPTFPPTRGQGDRHTTTARGEWGCIRGCRRRRSSSLGQQPRFRLRPQIVRRSHPQLAETSPHSLSIRRGPPQVRRVPERRGAPSGRVCSDDRCQTLVSLLFFH